MGITQDQRPAFFQGQYLGPEDLNAAVDYARVQDALHSLGAHTWGLAMGLELVERAGPGGSGIEVYVSPGYAWDGYGRPIVMLSPYPLSVDLFKSFTGADERLIDVWIRYREEAGIGEEPARIRETFAIEAGNYAEADQHSPIAVAFSAVEGDLPKDRSLPFQIFPDSTDPSHWLVSLGSVRWQPPVDGAPGYFVARNEEDKKSSEASRQLAGVVAARIAAPGQELIVENRMAAAGAAAVDAAVADAPDFTMTVRGTLDVKGDLKTSGKPNFLHVVTKTMVVPNVGDVPTPWTCDIKDGKFAEIYATFAVLQGFSLWPQPDTTQFKNWGHVALPTAIPQHVFVRVDGHTTDNVAGVAFCSESDAALQGDNSVLFTVVVMGRAADP
jgi:hypothetical protein